MRSSRLIGTHVDAMSRGSARLGLARLGTVPPADADRRRATHQSPASSSAARRQALGHLPGRAQHHRHLPLVRSLTQTKPASASPCPTRRPARSHGSPPARPERRSPVQDGLAVDPPLGAPRCPGRVAAPDDAQEGEGQLFRSPGSPSHKARGERAAAKVRVGLFRGVDRQAGRGTSCDGRGGVRRGSLGGPG